MKRLRDNGNYLQNKQSIHPRWPLPYRKDWQLDEDIVGDQASSPEVCRTSASFSARSSAHCIGDPLKILLNVDVQAERSIGLLLTKTLRLFCGVWNRCNTALHCLSLLQENISNGLYLLMTCTAPCTSRPASSQEWQIQIKSIDPDIVATGRRLSLRRRV